MKNNKNLPILFLSRSFPPVKGGIEKQNNDVYISLSQITHVKLIANKFGKFFLPLFLSYVIIYVLIYSRHYRTILLGDGVLTLVSWFLRKFKKIKYPPAICIIHGLDITYSNPIYQRLWVRHFFNSVDTFITVSEHTASILLSKGIHNNRCKIIPNGINPFEYENRYQKDSLLNKHYKIEDKYILLTIGRLVKRKGIHWFIENVMPKLEKNTIYVIAGKGVMWNDIKSTISKNGLEERVLMIGEISNTDRDILYNSADIFIQPNIKVDGDTEGFGLVVLEAGASGLPVIASRLEGIKDAICEGYNGYLLTPEQTDEWVSKINQLIQNPRLRKEKGRQAENYVKKL